MSNKDPTLINIIYLIDTTLSMNKNKEIVYSLKNINDALKLKFVNIQFGFVLYKDFYIEDYSLKLNQSHIKVYPPSKKSFINDDIDFIAGYDYAEDWANAYYEISQLHLDYDNYQNIIIHFCDSGAHGKRFSDYDYKNEQENLLIEALNFCALKKFKIIGLLYNEFARKSFLACAKIYKGYYNLVDLTLKDITKINNFYKIIFENINYALINKKNMTFLDDYSQIKDYENDFNWENRIVNMTKLKDVKNKNFNNLYYLFLPILKGTDIQQINKFVKSSPTPNFDPKTGLKQGRIGDCYLISPIISLIYNKIPLTEYIFPETYYDENTEKIEMYIYEKGIRKLITFKNTYATNNNYFIFSSPLDNVFFGMSIEKGFAANKSDRKTIKSGFEKIGYGGRSFRVFNSLFGTESEIYKKKDMVIQKEEIKNKIKKYLDFNGLISFSVHFNITNRGHAFALIGYKEYQYGEFYVEILNPWHKGKYLENNIKKNDVYDKSSEKIKSQFDSEKAGKNIYEEEFQNNKEIYDIFNNYEKTGFLTMKLNTFINWFSMICFCDPMLGYLESIVEINKGDYNNNMIYFQINKETKFRAYLLESDKKISDLNEQMEYFQNSKDNNQIKYCIYLEKDNNNDNRINKENSDFKNLIYEKLIPGKYVIKIYPTEIKNNLYLKIQANDIIISDSKRKVDISNGCMNRYNCNCLDICLDKYPSPKQCYFCQIYYAYQLIDKIVISIIKLINFYNYIFKNIEIYTEILPVYSEYNISCISYSYLYYHFMSTLDGFIVLIINKSNFNWECKSRIEYNKHKKQFTAFFEFGTFKITNALIIFDYENSQFKNILASLGYNEISFNLFKIDDFIKLTEQKKLKQIKSQYDIEVEKLEKIINKQIIEQKKLEQDKSKYNIEIENLETIKSQYIIEKEKLEGIKSQYNIEFGKLENFKNQWMMVQQNLESIKNQQIIEQQKLEQIKNQKNKEEQKLEQIKNQQNAEQQKLESIKNQRIIEQQELDQLKMALKTEKQNLEQLKNIIKTEKQDLDKRISLRISEQQILDKIKTEKEKYKNMNLLENILINLEESKINFKNNDGSRCYQSSTFIGFIHLLYPKAIRKLNEETSKKGKLMIKCLDELKNNILFNDMIIDILKEINNKENERKYNSNNNNKNYEANEIFKNFPPENGSHQGLLNEYDCHKLHERAIYCAKSTNSEFSKNDSVSNSKDTYAKNIEINNRTIISDVLKLKIENDLKTYANLVLKINENDLKDNNLNIFKLIKNCPQLNNGLNNSSHKKITEISDIIYIIIERVEKSKAISKKFVLGEKLYFDKISKNFKEYYSNNCLLYELQFIIYHSSCNTFGGHFIAYQKIKGEWYYFNDLDYGYAEKKNPPLNDTDERSNFPVIVYYVLNK